MLVIYRVVTSCYCKLINWLQFRIKGVQFNGSLNDIKGVLCVAGNGTFIIGKGTKMNSGSRKNPIGGDTQLALVCRGGQITIGENCGLSNCAIVSDSSVTLGNGVLLGGGVKVYDTNFHSLSAAERALESDGNFFGKSDPIVIKDGAFVGGHSIILKGVTIGQNAVVGAGSVVTKNIPDGQIWGGNPAIFIRNTD